MGVVLCDETDIQKRLGGRALTPAEVAVWPGMAEESTDMIEAYCNTEWMNFDDVPRHVRTVCSRMVVRTFNMPAGTPMPGGLAPGVRSFQSSIGPLGHTTTFGDGVMFGSPWLSKADKMILTRGLDAVHNELMYEPSTCSQQGYDWTGV